MAVNESLTYLEEIKVNVKKGNGPMPVRYHGLGISGIRKEAVLKTLKHKLAETEKTVIRLFVQEYYEMYQDKDQYNWSTLDESIRAILDCGAEPLLSLCMKPHALYPKIDQTIVHPNNYQEWQRFISAMVKHYNKELKWKIKYWEIFNEPDIGEDGGCPGLFSPEDYCLYYEKTVDAILNADPHVKVGGPALAYCKSPILPYFLRFCVEKNIRIDFISWHIYSASPEDIGKTVQYVKQELSKYPELHCETILNEWNIPHWGEVGIQVNTLLEQYPTLRCAYMLAVIYAFCKNGLDRSNFYHTKEVSFEPKQFEKWFSEKGVRHMDNHWNKIEQTSALFAADDSPRPHFYAYKLFQSLNGEQLQVESLPNDISLFAVKNENTIKLLVWNYNFKKPEKRSVKIQLTELEKKITSSTISILDHNTVKAVLQNENLTKVKIEVTDGETLTFEAEPFGVYFVELTC